MSYEPKVIKCELFRPDYEPGQITGGLDLPEKPATAEIQSIVDGFTENIKEISGKDYTQFKAIAFKSQPDSYGTFHFIKIDCGIEIIHLKVREPSSSNGPEMHFFFTKTNEDPIGFF